MIKWIVSCLKSQKNVTVSLVFISKPYNYGIGFCKIVWVVISSPFGGGVVVGSGKKQK